MLSEAPTPDRRPVLPLLLLHLAAAGVCFAFFSITPAAVLLLCMAIGNDPGGPMVFPIVVLGSLLGAAIITALIAGAALSSDILRRHYPLPVWVPPIVVLGLATLICWLFFRGASPALPPIVGAIVALAFAVHWAAVSAVWYLGRRLWGAARHLS